MWNRNKASNISKGLLLTVVLFCFSACKSSSTESTTNNTTMVWDSTMPDPARYLLFGNGEKQPKFSDSLSLEELDLLEEGDILLRKGFGSVSDFIADFLDETYPLTHCAFVVNTKNKVKQVLHTASNETINCIHLEPLEEYIRQSTMETLVLVRLKCSKEKKAQILQKAHQLLAQKIPFDMGFDDRDNQALYCIELMRNIFLDVFEEDWLPKRKHRNNIDVLSMDNFFNTTHFEVIFNHFDSVVIDSPSTKQ